MRFAIAIGAGVLAVITACGETATCAEGTNELNGKCVPVCLEACGDHQQCFASDTQAQCECVAGYQGDPCVWGGALEDPEFTNPDVWFETTNGATVQPLAAGLAGPGVAAFQDSVVCNAGAVSQTVQMPPYEFADRLVIEIVYRATDTNGVAVGYNRAFTRLANTQGVWETRRICIGEAGYGGPVKFQVAAAEPFPSCFTNPVGTIEVDRFEILVADPMECQERGTVSNGEGELEGGGWFFEPPVFPGQGIAKASFEPDVGKDGSSAARLYKEAGANARAAMGTSVSVPLKQTMPSPALRFWWRGTTPGQSFRIEFGTFENVTQSISVLDEIVSDGSEHTYTYCLPPWTFGNDVELAFVQQRVGDFVGEESELIVDDVELFSDPRCGESQDLQDPGFDSAPYRWAHVRAEGNEKNAVNILDDADRARTGSGVLQLLYGTNQERVVMGTRVWVPPSEGDRGPQLVFYSKVPSEPKSPVRWIIGFPTPDEIDTELLPGGEWRTNTVCLPPEWANRWYRFSVTVFPSTDPLETFDPPKEILLDDFELRIDEACPAITR